MQQVANLYYLMGRLGSIPRRSAKFMTAWCSGNTGACGAPVPSSILGVATMGT